MRLDGPVMLLYFGCFLISTNWARGNQIELPLEEVANKNEVSNRLESTLSEHNEAVPVPEPIQYKTAEIADAMQAADLHINPAVLISMVPREAMALKTTDSKMPVCDSGKERAECNAESLMSLVKGTADGQDKPKMNDPDKEQAKSEETNSTDNNKPLKVNCEGRNLTGISNFTVKILNVTQDLMEFLNPNSSECSLVLFYTPWCRFSAGLAPHFNSLPRAFPTLHFLALDASQHSSLSTRFGTVAVPNILLFQGAKPMARFNHTDRKLEALKSFIFNQSGIEAVPGVVVTEEDCENPLPCVPHAGIDWLLVFSLFYVTIFIVYATMQTERIRWLIPGQEHEHQD
ncbi:hypothetical protein GDO86_005323 [Hymenochirus boettgeri]|uniref:Thioredoxin domain-containing protein n=1 Tax=Hymenochirus boettgeri TaxID=247094 RepID=A0A8T2J8W0_9PIPI|nr:hypothetical protein GDO86_005323 [Hymenochirus boettgeri]